MKRPKKPEKRPAEKAKASLQRIKYRDFTRKRSHLVKGVLERKAGLERADMQWQARNQAIEERAVRERRKR